MNRLQKELGNFVKVKNMVSDNGNTIANQFIIHYQCGVVFQSYDSIIAVQLGGKVLLGVDWDYSRTTAKYRNKFTGQDTKTTQARQKSGEWQMIDEYNNEITPCDFERLDNCVNGNPRYYLGWCAVSENVARACGATKYRGKLYGAGWVFQSYNLQVTCDHLNDAIKEERV